jgi:hypothetical protein
MWNLKQCLSGLQTGQAVIVECRTFESMNLFDMNKKLQTKGIEDVIAEITGEDIDFNEDSGMLKVLNNDNCDQRAKTVLRAKYNEFKKQYEKIITKETKVVYGPDNKTRLPITYKNVRYQILKFRVNEKKWLDDDIEKLPELLALIFSLWTLLKSEHFERERER